MDVKGTCRIRPNRKQQFPRGFRKEALYAFIGLHVPNGTSDLHYLVIDDQGSTVPLPVNQVQIVEVFGVKTEGPLNDQIPIEFKSPSRIWKASIPASLTHVTCYDLNRSEFKPHSIEFNDGLTEVTVKFSRPKSGILVVG